MKKKVIEKKQTKSKKIKHTIKKTEDLPKKKETKKNIGLDFDLEKETKIDY